MREGGRENPADSSMDLAKNQEESGEKGLKCGCDDADWVLKAREKEREKEK